MLNRIGNAIVDEVEEQPNRAFLFGHVADGWAEVRLYIDRGKAVQLMAPGNVLPKLALEFWKVENVGRPPGLRWVYFEYDLRRRKLSTKFVYPEEIKQGTGIEQWIEAGVRKRFREKPVVELDDSDPEDAATRS